MRQLLLATSTDPLLQILKSTIIHGWPEKWQGCHPSISKFWNFWDELLPMTSSSKERRSWSQKLFVPRCWWRSSPVILASTRWSSGPEKYLSGLAWQLIAISMLPCAPSKPKEPLLPHAIPSCPWQKVGTDLFTWDNKNYQWLVTLTSTADSSRSMNCQAPLLLPSSGSCQLTSPNMAFLRQWRVTMVHHWKVRSFCSDLGLWTHYLQPRVSTIQWPHWEVCPDQQEYPGQG